MFSSKKNRTKFIYARKKIFAFSAIIYNCINGHSKLFCFDCYIRLLRASPLTNFSSIIYVLYMRVLWYMHVLYMNGNAYQVIFFLLICFTLYTLCLYMVYVYEYYTYRMYTLCIYGAYK